MTREEARQSRSRRRGREPPPRGLGQAHRHRGSASVPTRDVLQSSGGVLVEGRHSAFMKGRVSRRMRVYTNEPKRPSRPFAPLRTTAGEIARPHSYLSLEGRDDEGSQRFRIYRGHASRSSAKTNPLNAAFSRIFIARGHTNPIARRGMRLARQRRHRGKPNEPTATHGPISETRKQTH
jgi:hypothetical protein